MNEAMRIELEHLMELLAPPYTEGWRAYCWDKAKRYEREDAIYAGLPEALAQRMRTTETKT